MKTISATSALKKAWEVFKSDPLRHLGVILLALLVYFVLTAIWPFRLRNLVSMFLSPVLLLFIVGYSLDVVRERYGSIGEVWTNYVSLPKWIQAFIAYLIISFGSGLLMLPFIWPYMKAMAKAGTAAGPDVIARMSVPQMPTGLFILGLVATIILIYLSLRLMFVFYFIGDKGYSAIDAFKASWKVTGPYLGQLLLFSLLALLLVFVGLMVFVVGIFVVIPIIYFAYAVLYEEITGEETADETPLEA
jgi:uncharacterized membrane protein